MTKMSAQRVQSVVASLYKQGNEQGIIDIAVLLNTGEIKMMSLLEGSTVGFVASALRNFADTLENIHTD